MTSFDPTEPQPYLDWAETNTLRQHLTDLPTLADLLDRNYDALLRKGDRDPDDSSVRYVVKFDVLDLADRRTKWEHSATRTEPLTLADRGIAGPTVDPEWWEEMARRLGARRQGITPTLTAWVSLTVGKMHTAGHTHLPPLDPDDVVYVATTTGTVTATKPGPSVGSEAGWLRRHLDWIAYQPWAPQLAGEVADMIRDLERIVGPADATPQAGTVQTTAELANILGIPASTVRRWASPGGPLKQAEGRFGPLTDSKGRRLYYLTDARALARGR